VGSYPLKKVLDRRQGRAGEYADNQRDPDGDHRPSGAGIRRRYALGSAQVRTRKVEAQRRTRYRYLHGDPRDRTGREIVGSYPLKKV